MDKKTKQEIIASFRDIFSRAASVVIVHYQGINVPDISSLRYQAGSRNVRVKVVKNRLMKVALKGSPYEGISGVFSGPVMLFYSFDDEVSPAKLVSEALEKKLPLVWRGGGIPERPMSIDQIKALSLLPSFDEVRGGLVGLLVSPARKLISILNAPAEKMVRVCDAYASK